jgi:hypothetical protein
VSFDGGGGRRRRGCAQIARFRAPRLNSLRRKIERGVAELLASSSGLGAAWYGELARRHHGGGFSAHAVETERGRKTSGSEEQIRERGGHPGVLSPGGDSAAAGISSPGDRRRALRHAAASSWRRRQRPFSEKTPRFSRN